MTVLADGADAAHIEHGRSEPHIVPYTIGSGYEAAVGAAYDIGRRVAPPGE